jgi:hypothetical protein
MDLESEGEDSEGGEGGESEGGDLEGDASGEGGGGPTTVMTSP